MTKTRSEITLGELTQGRVQQDGPTGRGEFTYVDIGSIDRTTKRIVDANKLPIAKAPSRARQILKAGDVLVSMTRPNLNAVAIVPPDLDGAIGSTGFHVMRAQDNEPGYLFYAAQTPMFIDSMCQKVQGALYPAVRPKDIAAHSVPRIPKSEQRRIVAEIEKQFSRLEEGVGALRRVQANLKRYRAAVLKAACEGQLVPTEAELAKSKKRKFETGEELLARILAERRKNWQGRGKYKEPAAPNTSKLGKLPEGWAWATLDQVSYSIQDGNYGEQHPKPSDFVHEGIPFLSAAVIGKDGQLISSEFKYISPELHKSLTKAQVVAGDILFPNRGARDAQLKGMQTFAVFLPAHIPEANINPQLTRIKVAESFSSHFLRIALCSPTFLSEFRKLGAGSALGFVGLTKSKTLVISVPPLAEQSRIVAEVERRLSVVEEMEATVEANLQRATRLRQSILQKAFEGML